MELLPRELIELGGAGILLALFLGTFVSEDLACITAGSLIAAGKADPFAAVLACLAGIVLGDLTLFAAGRFFGRQILESNFASRFVARQSLDRASEWLSAKGTSAIFISRFVSGLRLPTYFLSGVLHLDVKRFAILVAVGAAVWTPIIVFVSALWNTAVPLGAVVALITFCLFFHFGFRLTDRRRRRLTAGKIKRIWNWEFWPLWLFYIPVVLYIAYLAIRFRGLHFTAANPGIPASGFVGESKDAIYKSISNSPVSSGHLLRHLRIAADESHEKKYRLAKSFIAENALLYPIVVKPDAGERGNRVVIAQDELDLESALLVNGTDVLIQEYAAGIEASVFYHRFPNEQSGRIFSITEKDFPTVIGDGILTIEELILADPRAHIIADSYFRRNASRLANVPPLGEIVALVDIGAHSKGAIFTDGGWMQTVELAAEIDELSRGIPGFYFGRYDLRSDSYAELSSGNFKILELNGVTSESTNIYDPRYSLFDAYRILFDQWQTAFEIGRENSRAGASPASLSDLISLFVSSKRLV